jgi:hypothetical protein
MTTGRKLSFVLALSVVLSTGAVNAQQPSLRLSGIPKRLELPLPSGSNLVLTATVQGASPKQVWLAKDRSSSLRALFTPTGGSEFQINLAADEVTTLLKASATRKFQVFAELPDGKVLQSIPVSYAVRQTLHKAPYCRAYQKGADTPKACTHHDIYWCVPTQITKIEVTRQKEAEPGPVRLAVGKKEWAFEPYDQKRTSQMRLTPEIHKAWKEKGALMVQYKRGPSWQTVATLNAKPGSLDFPGHVESVTIYQRRWKKIPGSRNYLSIRLGDITGGQVRMGVVDLNYQHIIEDTSVGQGDCLTLKLAEEQYVIFVRRMINQLLGDDWVVIDISRIDGPTLKKIEKLLTAVESSEDTWLSGEESYTGREMAASLRERLTKPGPRIKKLDDFISLYASRPSPSAKAYRVKTKDGKTLEAKRWYKKKATSKKP